MPKSIEQIRVQIAKLQEREKALLQKEAVGVIARIKGAVAHYGITPEQIFGDSGIAQRAASVTPGRRGAVKAAKSGDGKRASSKRGQPAAQDGGASDAASGRAAGSIKGTKVAAKYKDSEGNTWSGRGSRPRWLRAAIEAGKTLEDFAIA